MVDPPPRLRLMDGFALEMHGREIALTQSVQRLLVYLAVHDHPLTRSYVAGGLWPEVTQERAAGNLRSTLWRLRQSGADVVTSTAWRVSFRPGISVDLHNLEGDTRRCLAGQDVPGLETRLGGDLLPEWTDEWLIVIRERLRQLRLHALEALGEQFLRIGAPGRAIDVSLTSTEIEPLRESGHRLLIKAYLAEGNVGEAVREYDAFARMLRRELGIHPSPAFENLLQLLRGTPIAAALWPVVVNTELAGTWQRSASHRPVAR